MNKQDKPLGAKLGWKRLSTSYPFVTPWLRLRQDRIHIEDKGEIAYTYRESNGAVGIVPITDDGQIVMIRQYRYTVDDWCLEIPAGGTHDREGVALEEVAREELREETGATCRELRRVASFYASIATSDEVGHVFLALGVEIDAQPHHESTEIIKVHPMPVAEVARLARTGQIKDGLSALCILLSEGNLRELGYLS